ncbi:hypothetical protein OWM54_27135 [Myxococcus sp. MISCRS1]|uniref:Lipoprotein n=1 Tax=Myxococcus fulvus TaxID=33 RepID=A0A511SZ24_MYXFU|nr:MULTISPECIES: hypothetical protein [Myxococcus]AKF87098.1 hypothetical protein MFUL124B02_37540 [Myxococcus fulvus 124B02]BDT37625.1 hypothetical protein MFMH1_72940 [Myxococcus sp. MH1]MBZ4396120.1 hypothetical protein [Myxococcus sp. AS-1-15]MBZ4408772.1 hypothetical protein [Myxococcus sp. XM-1-1-1]MCK8498628.1 hypothetical protein [Myxococcus fulvus]
MRWFVISAILFASSASAQTPECKAAKKEYVEREGQLTTLKQARKDMREVLVAAKKGRAHSRALDALEKADDAMEDAVKRATSEQAQRDKLTKEICK